MSVKIEVGTRVKVKRIHESYLTPEALKKFRQEHPTGYVIGEVVKIDEDFPSRLLVKIDDGTKYGFSTGWGGCSGTYKGHNVLYTRMVIRIPVPRKQVTANESQ